MSGAAKSRCANLQKFFQHLFCSGCVMAMPVFLAAGSVTVSWDANTESDLSGYRLYYGTRPADYSKQIWVGNATSYRVTGLEEGRRYFFALTAVDFSGNESGFSNEVSVEIPRSTGGPADDPPASPNTEAIAAAYNFPNPFRVGSETTTIRYELAADGEVTIDIVDLDNSIVRTLVRNAFRPAGESVQDAWDGRNAKGEFVANGVYFCRIRTADFQHFIKVAVIR